MLSVAYESKIHDGPSVDMIKKCPKALSLGIFNYLSFTEMSLCCRVSRSWRDFAGDSVLMKTSVYRDVAFAHRQWTRYFQIAGIEAAEDPECMARELDALHPNIGQILKSPCPIFFGKRIVETHVMFCLSGKVTIETMRSIAQIYYPRNVDGFKYMPKELRSVSYEPPGKECEWGAMTIDVVPGSRNQERFKTQGIMNAVREKAKILYTVPTTRQSVACIMAKYLPTCSLGDPQVPGIRLFSIKPLTFTRSGTSMYFYPHVVGGFSEDGFIIDNAPVTNPSIGVAAVRDVSRHAHGE